jgi:importin subunit beta-1
MPFITANISKNTTPADWHYREAATFAYGSILDGPQPSAFADTVKQALGFLLQAMKVCVLCVRVRLCVCLRACVCDVC